MTIELSMREWLVLTFIVEYERRHDYSPSIREIAAYLGKQPGAGVTHALKLLRKKGVLAHPYRKGERIFRVVRSVRVAVQP